jgi:plastocyanin
MLASIPADVSKRLVIISCVAALFAAACSNPPEAKVSYGSGVTFVPFVADNLDNAGMGNAVALDSEGIPYISYWIFPAEPKKDAIPIPRPIGSPFIATTATPTTESQQGAAVGVASLSADGVWTRGAAAQVQDTPKGIYVPYGPATVDSMIGATAKNTNGTDIAIDANGAKHVVWTGPDGVWYATGTDSFTATQVYAWPSLDQAGPVGRPSIAVDADGVAWVAFAIDTASGQEVRVATLGSSGWTTEVAASSPLCSGCPQPAQAQIGITPDGPMVVYVDGSSGELQAARQTGSAWTVETITSGVVASDPSLVIDKDGAAHVAYYTADAVYVASSLDPGWVDAKVADAQPMGGTGNAAQTTGIATDDAGATYVTWADAAGGVTLVKSEDGQTFNPVETPGTSGGAFPSLGVTPDGSHVYLAWYAVSSQDLLLGVESDVDGLLIAQPSPTPTEIPSQGGGTCAPTDSTDLTIVAANSLFDVNCLAVTPATKFAVTLDNQDPVPHDFSIYPSSSDLQNPLFSSLADPNAGESSTTYDIDPLDEGTYFFQCDFHPTSMTGTFIVAKK